MVVAMMVSFPIQGYGLYSIIFSTLHTVAVMVFIIIFFRQTKGEQSVSAWFARAALVFFFLSTAGPFSLGYLMANGLGDTVWYNFSIYYYLHFQYNGFFFFGILSLFYQLLEKKGIRFDRLMALTFGKWMAIACVPAYALSILFAQPGLLFNAIGTLAAIVQLLALAVFHRELRQLAPSLRLVFNPASFNVLKLVFLALVIKSALQFLSAHPEIAALAYLLRPIVIAYLHLVLVGVITYFLLVWYVEMKYVTESLARTSMGVLFSGFAGSELCLVIMPWWSDIVGRNFPSAIMMIFFFSILLLVGTLLFYLAFLSKSMTKVSFPRDDHHPC